MTPLIFAVQLLLADATLFSDGGNVSGVVAVDGGVIPVVAPGLTHTVEGALAPELVPDGGTGPTVAPQSLSVYDVDLPVEIAVTATTAGLYFMADILVKPTLQGATSCGGGQCNPNDLSAFDRYAVGKSSPQWRTFSDVALIGSLVLPVLYLGLESIALPTQTPWGDFFNDLLVISESMALTASLDTVLKFAFRRPRPIRYVDPAIAGQTTFDDELSLPSGHAAMVTAATTALTTTIFLRHPDSKVRYVFLTGGILLSCLASLARVEAGEHFPTDVITGVVIGAFSGFIVPYLHRKKPKITPTVSYNPSSGATTLSVSGAF